MPSSAKENYLKAIHRLGLSAEEGDWISLGDVAQDLSVTPGTVTTMVKALEKQGMLRYRPREGVQLTPTGVKTALGIVRRHRLIEMFLSEVMEMDWADVHREAEVLEHVVSDTLILRMSEMLGHPDHDPHGAPIPDGDGVVPEERGRSLADCQPGRYRLARVKHATEEFLSWLTRHGLVLGADMRLVESDPVGGTWTIEVVGGEHPALSVGVRAAERLFVISNGDRSSRR